MTSDKKLCDLIYNASAQAFKEWRQKNLAERVFAFALSTIDDAIYVNASLNSEESHKRRLEKRKIDSHSVYGLSAKWGPWEWENEYTGQSYFTPVDELLKQMYDKRAESSFAQFRATVFDSMLQALERLRIDAVVTNEGDSTGIVMFATIYDSFDAKKMHRRSAELLNPPTAISELLSVIGG